MLTVVREMLNKDPEKRPSAGQVERQFANSIQCMEGILKMHCVSKLPPPSVPQETPPEETAAYGMTDGQQQQQQQQWSPSQLQPLSPFARGSVSGSGGQSSLESIEQTLSGRVRPLTPATIAGFDFGIEKLEDTAYEPDSDAEEQLDYDIEDFLDESENVWYDAGFFRSPVLPTNLKQVTR